MIEQRIGQAKGRVLVTGASGFLGHYVTAGLLSTGWQVRAALRTSLQPIVFDVVSIASIDGSTDWTAALKNVDAVVHLAGLAHLPSSRADAARDAYFEINTAGTLRLARAAADCVRTFIFVSSIGVNGSTTFGRDPFTEKDPARPATPYAESKAKAEEGILALSANHKLLTTIVRPPLIYGTNAKGNFAHLSRAVRLGIPIPVGAVCNRRAFVSAENVTSFLLKALEDPNKHQGVFIIADDEQVSTAEFLRRTAAAMSRSVYLPRVPPNLVQCGLHMLGRRSVAESLLQSLEVDTTKARSTQWRPPLSLDAGLKRALSTSTSIAYR